MVVPVRDGADTIGPLLAALLPQARARDAEVIVVDNGSTDGTAEAVRARGVEPVFEPVPGPAAARNRGVAAARGSIVAFLDADAVPSRRWLAQLVAAFDDPGVLLAGGRIHTLPPETDAEWFVEASGVYDAAFHLGREAFAFLPSGNLAIRRDAFTAVGGFDPTLRTGEDLDLSQRIRARFPGGKLVIREGAVVLLRNRTDAAGLRRQAHGYGRGAAELYRRYPDVAMDAPTTRKVVRLLARRAVKPALVRVALRLGRASERDLVFARYHRLWTWAYWRGFAAGSVRVPAGR